MFHPVNILMVRKWQTHESTISTFSIEGSSVSGFILEEKGPSTTIPNLDRRIPAGAYRMEWYNSPRFQKRLSRLFNQDVSRDRQILIHVGNTARDTEGCLLPGTARAANSVRDSRSMCDRLFREIDRLGISNLFLVIREDFEDAE